MLETPYPQVSHPPSNAVVWACQRRKLAPNGKREPLFVEVRTNGIRTVANVMLRRYSGRTAWEVWQRHLARHGGFAEFEINVVNP